MKSTLLICLLFLINALSAGVPGDVPDKSSPEVREKMNNVRIPWIQNNGQQPDEVAFYAKTFAGTVFVNHSGELIYNLPVDSTRSYSFTETFISDRKLAVTPGATSETKVNYFIGSNSENWKTDISTFQSVNLGELWKGIKVECNAYGNNIEKLFYVEPGIDPANITISVSGSKKLRISDSGELIISTLVGETRFTKPIAYQIINQEKVYCHADYRISNESYSFKVSQYNPNLPLIIDPLLASTFIGGSNEEEARSIYVDSENNIYITGETTSLNFPSTPGSYDYTYDYGDDFISKFNEDLSQLLVSTFISFNQIYSLTIDNQNNIYVSGSSGSWFPIITGCYYSNSSGAGICKLNPDLNNLIASAIIGGTQGSSLSYSICVDQLNNVIIAGKTDATNFVTTPNAFDQTHNGGTFDAFISKLNPDLTILLSSTFLGGNGEDRPYSVTSDIENNIYVTGVTNSNNFPVTPYAFDEYFGGITDVFISKFNPDLSSLISSTYVGGSNDEYVAAINLDFSNNVIISGTTGSADFPITPGAYDETLNWDEIFVSILNSDLTNIIASTFIGGAGADRTYSMLYDKDYGIYLAGWNDAGYLPTISGTYDSLYNPGYGGDGFICRIDTLLTNLTASTYLGGSNWEYVNSLAIDSSHNIYVTGFTTSSDFPTTPNGFSQIKQGSRDAFVSKLDKDLFGDIPYITTQPIDQFICEYLSASLSISCLGEQSVQWQVNEGVGYIDLTNNTIYQGSTSENLSINNVLVSMNGYSYRCAIIGFYNTVYSNEAILTVYDSTEIVLQPENINICEDEQVSIDLSALGNDLTYQWFKNGNLIPGANASILSFNLISLTDEGNYFCMVNGTCGNVISDTAFIDVLNLTQITFQPHDTTNCIGSQVSFNVIASGENLAYQWRKGGVNINGAILPALIITNISTLDEGFYDCVVTGDCGLLISSSAELIIGNTEIIDQPIGLTACEEDEVILEVSATGMNLNFQWRKDGENILGAIDPVLNFNPVELIDAGVYDCVVTGDCDSQTSEPATLIVHPLTEIQSHPISDTICEAENTMFTIGATGYNLSYQWLKNGNQISGATLPTYQIANAEISDMGLYSCQVSGECGVVISNSANLIVYETTEITINLPAQEIACEEDDIMFTVEVIGQNLSYQWRKDGVNIAGSDNYLNLTDISLADQGLYDCIITGTCGTITSDASNLIIHETTVVITQPNNSSVCEYEETTFEVEAVGFDLSYQWRKDGTDLPGQTDTLLNITNASLMDAGNYDCMVSGYCNTTLSESATLEVWQTTEIISQPDNITACEADDIQFSISAIGHNLSYQWYQNGTALTGETNPVLNLSNVTINDIGNYSCTITGDCGIVSSNTVSLDVVELVEFVSQPNSVTLESGDIATFSVAVTGPVNEYKWRKDEVYLIDEGNISGSASPELVITGVDPNDAGIYDCEITGQCNTQISEPANLALLGVNSVEDGNIRFYPNPTAGIIILSSIVNEKIDEVVFFNSYGEKVLSVSINHTKWQIDISGFEKGIYMMKVETNNSSIYARIIKI